jgi:hypothetical protein
LDADPADACGRHSEADYTGGPIHYIGLAHRSRFDTDRG